jgi:hypothetical protein
MPKLILLFSLILLSILSTTPATAQYCSIKELFISLPDSLIGLDLEYRKSLLRNAATPGSNVLIDSKKGYMKYDASDNPFEEFEIAVFTKKNGACVVAYHYLGDKLLDAPEDERPFSSNTKVFRLYEKVNGKWKNVTAKLAPVPINNEYLYKLPREGKSVVVKSGNPNNPDDEGKTLYILKWQNDQFVKTKS